MTPTISPKTIHPKMPNMQTPPRPGMHEAFHPMMPLVRGWFREWRVSGTDHLDRWTVTARSAD
jgi:hypothetical protein